MTFRVGMKVVCVASNGGVDLPGEPARGDISTVSNVYAHNGDLILELVEWPAPAAGILLAGWMAKYFRPVVETDISIFTAMLTSSKVDA